MPAYLSDALLPFGEVVRSGRAAKVFDTVEQLTGRRPSRSPNGRGSTQKSSDAPSARRQRPCAYEPTTALLAEAVPEPGRLAAESMLP